MVQLWGSLQSYHHHYNYEYNIFHFDSILKHFVFIGAIYGCIQRQTV